MSTAALLVHCFPADNAPTLRLSLPHKGERCAHGASPQPSQGGPSMVRRHLSPPLCFRLSSCVQGAYTSACLLDITLKKDLSGMPCLRVWPSPVQGKEQELLFVKSPMPFTEKRITYNVAVQIQVTAVMFNNSRGWLCRCHCPCHGLLQPELTPPCSLTWWPMVDPRASPPSSCLQTKFQRRQKASML